MGVLHQNIYPVIGACLEPDLSPYIIYPYASEGNLKRFLLRCRVSGTSAESGSHFVSVSHFKYPYQNLYLMIANHHFSFSLYVK